MGRGRVVSAAYTDGGKVSMKCEDCSCTGTSDDGTIDVFQSPSSGDLVASVNGGYTGVLETSCGSSIIAVGDILYELSGLDFIDRETDVISMSSADCSGVDIDTPADCYSGDTSSSLDGDIELSVTICYCKHVGGSATNYKSNVGATVKGATSITVPEDELHICFDFDYVSQMTAFVVADSTYYYDFELDIPGEDASSDLSISAAPPSSAGALMCGEEVDPTPSPVDPTPPTPEPTAPPEPDPTPSPVEPTAPPVEPKTPAPTALTPSPVEPAPTPPPRPPRTPAPVLPPTPAPVEPEPEPTSSPVEPVPDPTPAPEAAVEPTSPPVKPVPEPEVTPSPVAPRTPEPTSAPVRSRKEPEATVEPTPGLVTPGPLLPTLAPAAPPTAIASPAPSVSSNTSRPAATEATLGPVPLATPAPIAVAVTGAPLEGAGATSGPSAAGNFTSPAPSIGASTSAGRTVGGDTAAPVATTDGESHECDLPQDISCTQDTGLGNLNQGIGTFYDPVCNTTAPAEDKEPGCQGKSEVCRLCLFSTARFTESNPGEDLPNYTVCPCCVLLTYPQDIVTDADSSICESMSPAPSVVTTAPSPVTVGASERNSKTQGFHDKSLRVGGGNGVAVAALGLLGVLTFLPVCSK